MTAGGNLHRVLGVAFGLAVTVGITIGAGILRRPGAVAGALADTWLILLMWTLGGVYALLGALVVAELATTLPEAGGFFVWSHRAIGPAAGFAIGWCDFLSNSVTIAYCAVSIGELSMPFTGLPPTTIVPIAVLIVLVFSLIQWTGIRSGSRTQQITSTLLAASYLALVAAAFLFSNPSPSPPIVRREFPLGLFGALIFAMQSIVVTYDGWYQPAYFAEEIEHPQRDLPRSLIAGVFTVTAVFLLVNVALLYALPPRQLAASELPAADLAAQLFGSNGLRVISVLSLFALPPTINGALLAGSRVLFGLSRRGLFFPHAAAVNPGGTPHIALAMTAAMAMALILSGTFEQLLAIAGFFFVVNHCSAFASLFVLRRTAPHLPRPFPVPGYPITPAIVLLAGVGFLAGALVSDTRNSLKAAAFLALCLPVYTQIVRRKPQGA
ncbi:MAG: APC family permease [Bryobacterales bacterium]|nr:APC family permease [Bryobacterales bacterium]